MIAWFELDLAAYIVSEQLTIVISCIMQSPTTVDPPLPPVKRKYTKKDKQEKQIKKTQMGNRFCLEH